MTLYFVFSPIAVYLFQNNLNKVLEAQAGSGAGRPLQAPPQTAPEAPEQPAGTRSPPQS